MAEFYSTFESDFRDGKSLIGRPPSERLQSLRGQALLPLSQLLTAEGAYKFTRDRMTVGTFYAQSWALVHYLQVGDGGKRQGQLTRYLKMLGEGRPISDAFQGTFETTFDALQRELQSYVSRSTFQAALIDPGTTVLPSAVEPMTEADARFVQGDLLLKAGAAKEADDELVKALAAEPAHVDARVGRAEVQRQDGKVTEAIASLQEIASANPTNVRVRNALVTALQGARRYEEALAAGREAVKLNDGSASTWFAMSVAELAQGRESDSNNALVRADALLPETQWYRARAYSAYELARHDVVVRDAAIHLDRVRTDSDAAPYTAFLGALSYRKLNQPDQSMRILDRAGPAIVPGSWAEQVLLFLQDRSSAADFLRKAKTTGERTEAHAYIGILRSIASDRAGAVEHLQWVQEKGARNFVEYRLAVAELEHLAGAQK
jgi:tetratricopeptide (TPR) repeat protein